MRFYFPCLTIVCATAASDHAPPISMHTVAHGGRGRIRSSLLCLTSSQIVSWKMAQLFSFRSPPRCFITGRPLGERWSAPTHLRNRQSSLIRSPQYSSPKGIVGYRKYIKLSFFSRDIPRTCLVNRPLQVRFLKLDYESRIPSLRSKRVPSKPWDAANNPDGLRMTGCLLSSALGMNAMNDPNYLKTAPDPETGVFAIS